MAGGILTGPSRDNDGVENIMGYGDVPVGISRESYPDNRPATMASHTGASFWDFLLGIGLLFFNRFAIEKDLEKTAMIERTNLEKIYTRGKVDLELAATRLSETRILAEAGARKLGDTSIHDVPNRAWQVGETTDQERPPSVSMDSVHGRNGSRSIYDIPLSSHNGWEEE